MSYFVADTGGTIKRGYPASVLMVHPRRTISFAAYPFSGLSPAGWLPLSVADCGSLMMAGGKAKTKTK